MTTATETLTHEIEVLQRKRDELAVQLHLGKEEVLERWHKLEDRWLALQDKAKGLTEASDRSAQNVAEAARLLIDELHEGYASIRSKL